MDCQNRAARPASDHVEAAIRLYPPEMHPVERMNAERYAFHIDLVRQLAPSGAKVMDVGGGIGAFCLALALAGYQVTLVDDLCDPVNQQHPLDGMGMHEIAGVEVRAIDASGIGFDPEPGWAVMTTFDSIEHWHRSPKRALHRMVDALDPGGHLVVGVPNCVNLRKRLTVPFGSGKWSSMEAWYEEPEFRSHVREPDVDDLRYIARDLGLEQVRIFGRNWAGYMNHRRWVRALTPIVDRPLRLFPGLCADLYLVGRKPGAA